MVSGWPSRLMLRSLKSSHAPSTYSPSASLPAEKQRKVTPCSWQRFACGRCCGTQEVIAHLPKNADHFKRSNLNHMVLRTQISTSHPSFSCSSCHSHGSSKLRQQRTPGASAASTCRHSNSCSSCSLRLAALWPSLSVPLIVYFSFSSTQSFSRAWRRASCRFAWAGQALWAAGRFLGSLVASATSSSVHLRQVQQSTHQPCLLFLGGRSAASAR